MHLIKDQYDILLMRVNLSSKSVPRWKDQKDELKIILIPIIRAVTGTYVQSKGVYTTT